MMKRNLVSFACLLAILLTGCRAHMPEEVVSGKEDVAYFLFVSQDSKSVTVSVDNATPYTAQTVKSKKANRRGTKYSVPTGKHLLVVKDGNGKTLYSKEVFVSSQSTKTILLP